MTMSYLILQRTWVLDFFNPAGSSFDNEVIIEYFVERYRNRPSLLEQIEELHCLPTYEELLFDKSSNNENVENDEIPASFHRMALQYLSVQDFLVRGFHLARTESFYQIRSDIEAILKRIKPELVETFVKDEEGDDVPVNQLQLNGSSKRAALLASPPSILELTPARIGMSGRVPGSVKAEIQLDISNSARKGLGRDLILSAVMKLFSLRRLPLPDPARISLMNVSVLQLCAQLASLMCLMHADDLFSAGAALMTVLRAKTTMLKVTTPAQKP